MQLYIMNDFSLSMLDREAQLGTPIGYIPAALDGNMTARIPRPVSDPIRFLLPFVEAGIPIHSMVDSANMANIFSSVIGQTVRVRTDHAKLGEFDHCLIGLYVGPPLAEDAVELPENGRVDWWTL